jgi:uncharacterized membrane protein YqjE
MTEDSKDGENSGANPPTIPRAIREVANGVQHVFASELKLAKAEAYEAVGRTSRNSLWIAVSAVVIALAALPFMAFVVLGLGKILGENYWLASLLVAVLMVTLGGLVAYRAYRATRFSDLTLPDTRQSIEEERQAFKSKVRELRPRKQEAPKS